MGCKNPSCESFGQEHPNCHCPVELAQGGQVSNFCSYNRSHQDTCSYSKGGRVGDMNLKGYSKISSDHDETVLHHQRGHRIHVQHEALAPHELKALHAMPFSKKVQKLANGGKVAEKPQSPPPPTGTGISKEEADKFAKGAHFADGGMMLSPADRGAQYAVQHPDSQVSPSALGQISQAGGLELPEPLQTPSNIVQDAPGSTQMGSLVPQPPSESQGPINDLNANSDQFGTSEYGQHLERGIGLAEQGLQAQAAADIRQGKLGADASRSGIAGIQDSAKNYDQQLADIQQENKHLQDDVKAGHIDPNRYMGSLSTGGKIATIIGLIVGGAPAAHFLEKTIDQDIHAQEKDMENKQNLLSANMRLYGNIKDAKDAARLQMMSIAQLKMQQAAELSKSPQAQAALLKGMSDLEMKRAPLEQELAARRSLLSGQESGNVNPSLAVRFAPGDDTTKKAATKEIGEQENLNEVVKGSLRTFDEVSKLQSPGSRITSPIQSASQIDAKWGPMMDTITKQRAGRVTPQTVELFSQTKPSIFDTEETRKAKKTAFTRLLEEGERSTPNLDALGIKVKKKIDAEREKIPTIKRK